MIDLEDRYKQSVDQLTSIHESEQKLRLDLVMRMSANDRAKIAFEESLSCLQFLTAILSRVSLAKTPFPTENTCTQKLIQVMEEAITLKLEGHSLKTRSSRPVLLGERHAPWSFSHSSLSPASVLQSMKSPRKAKNESHSLYPILTSLRTEVLALSENTRLRMYATYQEQVHFPVWMGLCQVRQVRAEVISKMDTLLASRESCLIEGKLLNILIEKRNKLRLDSSNEHAKTQFMRALEAVNFLSKEEKEDILLQNIITTHTS